ncbi:MAG: SWIM zinc finger family protein [Anaerolineae bacterium]
MDSGMIGKIQKSKRYAEERHRIRFDEFKVTLEGDHATHLVSFQGGKWSCDCGFFARRGVCSHTMALERVLREMLPFDKSAG